MFLEKKIDSGEFSQFRSFSTSAVPRLSKIKWMVILFSIFIVSLFLPWTQNVRSKGYVSTLNNEQRPQQINSFISGRISKWYTQNGDIVKKGDTLVGISETKDEYLDPELLQRTSEQLDAKLRSAGFYQGKVSATEKQIAALERVLALKISQFENKIVQYTLQVQSDSIAMVAATGQFTIAQVQLQRQKELYRAGLKSLSDYEQKQAYYQDAFYKKIANENKYRNSKNELINISLERSAVTQEYGEKISKASGDRFAALSEAASGQGEAAKLQNSLFNYRVRKGFHYIIAPQDGQVLQSAKSGIGETVKEGEQLLTIVPSQLKKAIQVTIEPNDMPLISLGHHVRIQFDGFPAIIFSGWPETSYGLFDGRVSAIDNTIDASGKFRIWVTPDPGTKIWPQGLGYGTGCQIIALLGEVPLWYELWRQFNGFPPNFYGGATKEKKADK